MVGAAIFGLTYQQVFPQISALANLGSTVIPDLWNLNPYLVVLLFGLISVLLFYLIDRAGFHREVEG
ncbi:MAG TPA: hypothetical protein VE136_06975 [Anaerolineales bacterium]|nr:hypothetical protein [Anaerolineales bacterium]